MKRIILLLSFFISAASYGQSIFVVASGGHWQDSPVELGTRFTTSQNSNVTSLRFYKSTSTIASYTLKLYEGVNLIASATYTGTAIGWVSVPITPVKITTGNVYTTAYYSPSGYYQAATNYAYWPVKSGPITATSGVYKYGGGYPSSSSLASYFADIVFDVIPAPKDSIVVDGELYLRAATIKPQIITIPCDGGSSSSLPDSSTIMNLNGVNYKIYYFTKYIVK